MGPQGYLSKERVRHDLGVTTRSVAAGRVWLDRRITGNVTATHEPMAGTREGPMSSLTHRERDVVRLLVKGCDNKQIAQRLSISPRTVKVHLGAIFDKLGVTHPTEAAIYAMRHGLGSERA
jgi:DNA-binding NarL/FixJ family response regulator